MITAGSLIIILYVLGYLIALGIMIGRNDMDTVKDLMPLIFIALLSWIAVGIGLGSKSDYV